MERLGLFLLLAFVFIEWGQTHAQTPAEIVIIKPGDRRNVELGKIPILVRISDSARVSENQWQVLIDGVPGPTVPATVDRTEVDMPKPTGPHRIRVVLRDRAGSELASHEILVMAAPVEDHSAIFNRDWFAPLMVGFTVFVIGTILIGLRLRPRPAA